MKKELKKIEERYLELQKFLSSPEAISDKKKYQKYAKEYSQIEKIARKFGEYKKIEAEIREAQDLLSSEDEELSSFAKSEMEELKRKKDVVESELKQMLKPADIDKDNNVIVEIRAGTGGDEAAIFTGDLFRMYSMYVEKMGWKKEILSSHPTELGGFKEIIFSVEGNDVYKNLRFEKGTHRVQRIPRTETGGRIHTSAVTVAVLPEAKELDLKIDPQDLRIDTFRASGKGGQHLNVTDSAVRITHIPTEVIVSCQDERSQIKNKAKAMKILRARILEKIKREEEEKMARERKSQVGTGDRSQKIRTYNFPQDRVTDHRIGLTLRKIKSIMDGNLDRLIQKLNLDAEKI